LTTPHTALDASFGGGSLNVVLHEPEIPQNTGNIARTCAAVGAHLHLIRPLGFSTSNRYLKRAGLDYWHLVEISYYDSIEEFLSLCGSAQVLLLTTKAPRAYTEVCYDKGCCLVLGKESSGLPLELLEAHRPWCVRIPMREGARSLNLSNSAAIVIYEALRQLGFPSLQTKGTLLDGRRA